MSASWPIAAAAFVAGLGLAAAGLRLIRRRRRRRAWKRGGVCWSIGYQRSHHPLRWDPRRAKVLARHDVGEWARTLADPFLLRREGRIYLFCEVALRAAANAKIGVAEYDERHDAWEFRGIVLDEPFHLSFPFVFEHGGEVYLLPEAKRSRSIRLYRARDFPLRWELVHVLLAGTRLVDPCLLHHGGRFYLFASRKRRLYLYHAESLGGPWRLHPRSPLRRWNHARSAGRILEHEGDLYRFAQEQRGGYGGGVHAFRILALSAEEYREERVSRQPLLAPFGEGWARAAMHHLDVLALARDDYLGVFDGAGVVADGSAERGRWR